MNQGKIFENSWKDSVPNNCYYLRIADPAIAFNKEDNDKSKIRFAPKNPYDMFIYIYPNLFPFELKSTEGTAFSFKGTTPMIKKHQVEGLTKASKFKGIIPGFIFNMRKYNKTYFLHIVNFNNLVSKIDKSSINQKDIIDSGGIEIIGQIKKVKYRYFIGEFLDNLKEVID